MLRERFKGPHIVHLKQARKALQVEIALDVMIFVRDWQLFEQFPHVFNYNSVNKKLCSNHLLLLALQDVVFLIVVLGPGGYKVTRLFVVAPKKLQVH